MLNEDVVISDMMAANIRARSGGRTHKRSCHVIFKHGDEFHRFFKTTHNQKHKAIWPNVGAAKNALHIWFREQQMDEDQRKSCFTSMLESGKIMIIHCSPDGVLYDCVKNRPITEELESIKNALLQ